MSVSIFEMQMRFHVRVFANEDWQNFFSENKIFRPYSVKIPFSPYSEKKKKYPLGKRII
jgi:hypothetical protein